MARRASSLAVGSAALQRVLLVLVATRDSTCQRWHSASASTTSTCGECLSDLVLWDSLSESMKKVPLTSSTGKTLAWYTCGPTTYASMHLGHARTYVWLDMMRRVLESQHNTCKSRKPVLFVMNITDIDDKILKAASDGDGDGDAIALSRKAEAAFWKDMDRLNCLRPHVVTRVTEHVESDIVPYIEGLVDAAVAYTIPHDGVYFDVTSFEAQGGTYGKLAGRALQSSSSSLSQQSATLITAKRDARDFCLWKFRKPNELVAWLSPWGEGRPGWHIECSAMIQVVSQQFAETHQFLVHAGGYDLKFPHHTNEIAQAEAYHFHNNHNHDNHNSCYKHSCSKEWIPHWVHTGHLMVNPNQKMSKSLGNYLSVQELWFDHNDNNDDNSPADDFRMWCLMGGSYRHREEYSRSRIRNAKQQREKILQFLLDGERWIEQACLSHHDDATKNKKWSQDDYALFTTISTCASNAHMALLDDLNGTGYVANLIQIVEASSAFMRHNPAHGNVQPLQQALKSCRDLLALVGFSPLTVRAGLAEDSSSRQIAPAIVDELVRFRSVVRKAALEQVKTNPDTASLAKSLLRACDELRDNLPALGVEVMDTKRQVDSGKVDWRFCVPKERKS